MFTKVNCLDTRPVRGTLGRHACVCKVQAIWNPLGNSSRSKSYPPLSYSINRQDITAMELGMLLAVSHKDVVVGPDAIPLCRQNYSYWCSPEGLRHAAKLEVALRRSVATVACFTTWDVYGEVAAAAAEDASPLPMGPYPWQGQNRQQNNCHDHYRDSHREQQHQHQHKHKQEELAGIPITMRDMVIIIIIIIIIIITSNSNSRIRAIFCLSALAAVFVIVAVVAFCTTPHNWLGHMATIYDVAVHPAVRGQGIGRRLVKLLLQQIQARSVYDIGVVTPTAAVGFWERCSFGDDREGSTFMTFMGRPQRPMGHSSSRHTASDPDYLSDRSAWQAAGALEDAAPLDFEYDDGGSGFGAPYSSQELLRRADRLGHWDAAARSESLRTLLAEKLQRLREAPLAAGGGWGLVAIVGYRAEFCSFLETLKSEDRSRVLPLQVAMNCIAKSFVPTLI
ncbi:hypothetical protein VOLCADRAFT_90374 [Volvox carteri f. nagariensis]|uniref:N-acetyltransferase domain-containing protein n=1 Tax=Volvox carteri f. nagariensis TaxID=3068 RepID=D8TU74_VOLCA|nr:uncharacterized protein VOLCADRAFT_90374 [Volvox carteri f. nagariensis]EFJ49096.1 hypothetical protein VOLCADRAFT_90374 [Volvox carteri f. nagariensis]|eukprot:XP_002949993.1 hypothetical protein VOLCADRAFT_90374 [Volvox carteri f. nagariensis]